MSDLWTFICCWRDLQPVTPDVAAEMAEDGPYSMYEGPFSSLLNAVMEIKTLNAMTDWPTPEVRDYEVAQTAIMERIAREL